MTPHQKHRAAIDAMNAAAEAKHTPGPWDYDGPPHNLIVWSSKENRVCFLTSDGPTEANARLIASAPDLLAALKSILENDGGEGSKQYDARAYYDARNSGFAAISKAEGR